MRVIIINLSAVVLFLSCFSCATYYEINSEFNRSFESGRIDAAKKVLDDNKRAGRKKARFLYYANQGVVSAMHGDLKESNKWLERAYRFGEEYRKNAGNVVASFLVNPNTIVYPGEDHEHLLLLYYKAINNLRMQDYASALIECRRLNNRLNELSDKYKSDNKYKQDAFVHNLMGIAFEASGDVNNAFVAYRNALNIYESDYKKLFGLGVPNQLKKDLLRTAYLNGYDTDLQYFEDKFDMKHEPKAKSAELVFFWHNGLGPVKDEWSINFTTIDQGNGFVTFVNEDYNFSFPFQVSDAQQRNSLVGLRLFRVAFPKYQVRQPVYNEAKLYVGGESVPMELAEDVNKIALKTLEERMAVELGKGLLRAALKKTVEMSIRESGQSSKSESEKSDEEKRQEVITGGLSMLVGLVNAVTEKADTRNWQTIPFGIYYSRVPLQAGHNDVTLKVRGEGGQADMHTFEFDVSERETVFHAFHSLEYQKKR